MKNIVNKFCCKITSALGRLAILSILLTGIFSPSCRDFLDVVPDNTLTLEDIFSLRSEAYNALAKIYSYMPREDFSDQSSWLLGDEYMAMQRYTFESLTTRVRGMQIMRGLQTASSPLLGYWSGTGGIDRSLYEAIGICNVFIEHIDLVHDMDPREKAEWKAQAIFMKAYYHFLLLQRYGPIVIADEMVAVDAPIDELFPRRSKIDECFDYIVRTIDLALPNLELIKTSTELGMVDQLAALAI